MRTRPTRTSRAGCGCISSTAANHTANARMSSRSTRAGGDAHGPSRAVRSRLPERNTNERKVIMIVTKRIYEPVDEGDGYRVLVDRLWRRRQQSGGAPGRVGKDDLAISNAEALVRLMEASGAHTQAHAHR